MKNYDTLQLKSPSVCLISHLLPLVHRGSKKKQQLLHSSPLSFYLLLFLCVIIIYFENSLFSSTEIKEENLSMRSSV